MIAERLAVEDAELEERTDYNWSLELLRGPRPVGGGRRGEPERVPPASHMYTDYSTITATIYTGYSCIYMVTVLNCTSMPYALWRNRCVTIISATATNKAARSACPT